MIDAWRTASLRPAPIVVITCKSGIVHLLVLRSDTRKCFIDHIMAFNPAVRWRQCRQPEVCLYERGIAGADGPFGWEVAYYPAAYVSRLPFSLSAIVIFSV